MFSLCGEVTPQALSLAIQKRGSRRSEPKRCFAAPRFLQAEFWRGISFEFAVTRADPKKRFTENKTNELPAPVFGKCCFYEPFDRKTTPECWVKNPTTREREGKINRKSLHFAASGEGDTGVGGNGPRFSPAKVPHKEQRGPHAENHGQAPPEENENPMKSLELTRGTSSSLTRSRSQF